MLGSLNLDPDTDTNSLKGGCSFNTFPCFITKFSFFNVSPNIIRPQDSLESKKAYIPELDSQVAGLREWHPEEKEKGPSKKN